MVKEAVTFIFSIKLYCVGGENKETTGVNAAIVSSVHSLCDLSAAKVKLLSTDK